MSEPSPQHLLTATAALTLGALTFLPPGAGIVMLGLVFALARARGAPEIAHLAMVWSVLQLVSLVPVLASLWPLPLILGLGASWLLARQVPVMAGPWAEIRLGRVTRRDLGLGLLFAAISGVSLVIWFQLAQPDISDILARLPPWPFPALLGLGLIFATLNGLAEELAFRGLLMGALTRSWGGAWALAGQALIFGIMHWNGFPRGPAGVVLATIYGAMMGLVRRRADGLAASWLSHVLTDGVIYAILLSV